MNISLRIADTDLGTVINTVFKPQKKFTMALFPLPPDEWVGDQKCVNCNGKPNFLTEDIKPICNKCIDVITRGLNKKEMHEEPSIPVAMDVIANSRFEWSSDGDKWYSVKGKNIKTDRPDIFIKDLKKSIITKCPMNVEADYDQATKVMTLTI